MPRLQYVTVPESDLGAGIDQQSAENKIAPGYCEDIKNADPKSTGQIAKRTGYQGYAGYVPLRVSEVTYDNFNITLEFDNSVELPIGRSSPLVVLGKTSVASGDFATETAIYFDSFTADIRKIFLTGSNSLATIDSDEHKKTTPYLFVGVAESNSAVNSSNTQIGVDNIEITQSNFDVDIDYVNNSPSSFEGFVFIKDKAESAGETYITTPTLNPLGGGNTATAGSTTTFSIPASVHSLDNNNIIVKVYEDTGTILREITPDDIFLDDINGDISIDIVNNSVTPFDVAIILTAAPTSNFSTGTIADGATSSIVIDTSVTGGTDFAFVACYLESGSGVFGINTLEQATPDSIVADAAAETITITFTNNTGSAASFEIYWDFAEILTNMLTVTGSLSANFEDTSPQLTVYGLCHEEIYGDLENREGWVNHIDSYRAPAENRLICGLGGNLFAARLREEGNNADDYLIPLYYPNLNGRLLADTVIGPAFYDTGETPGRTRGFITGDSGGTNFFEIDSIEYQSGTGFVKYTLTVPSMVISGTLSTIIDTTSGIEDKFTAQQCGRSEHNGTFTIKTVTAGVDTLEIHVDNSGITSSDFDEVDVGGLGGVFTDRLTLNATSPFLPDDILISDIFDDTDIYTVINSSGAVVIFDGVVDTASLPSGLRIVGKRTSTLLPLRTFEGISSVDNIVRGDMLEITGFNRQFRVKSINQLADTAISIVGDGTEAVATVASTSTMFAGKRLLIRGTSSYNGEIEITALNSATEFTFATTSSTSEAGTIVGKTIEIDENLTFNDTTDNSITVNVDARWIPIELPEDNFDLTPATRVHHFDTDSFDNQSILRSTMVQDNLYLTNGNDEILKFDGTNIYRAGLFRWQPNLFVTKDTTPATGGTIPNNNPSIAYNAHANNRFTVTNAGDEQVFSVGDIIVDSVDEEVYTVKEIDTANNQVVVNDTISGGGSGNITVAASYSYYFRLNAVDANDNVIASAATGSDDFVVRLGESAQVRIKIIGMPAFDVYDYDRLEVQIYRTQANIPAVFYRLTTLAMEFDRNNGYILFTDTDSDEDLIQSDEVNVALKGGELGTAWTQPLRAKYCTTSGNRLVLGNLKDYPSLDINILKSKAPTLTQSIFTNASNSLWQFRKDNTDTSTGTDMINTARYEFRDVSAAGTITGGIVGTVGVSFTVTAVGHGLSAGDWVYLFHSTITDGDELTYSGLYHINSVVAGTSFTILDTNSEAGAASNTPDKFLQATLPTDIPVPIGTDGNYTQVNGNRSSSVPYQFLAIKRLAEAINMSMRKVDTSVSGYSDFEPWMVANAGNEFNSGQLVIRQPRIFDTTLEIELPSLSGDFSVFINNLRRDGSSSASSITRLYPSRIIASYQNYPEIFDNPTTVIDTESDSVIDINSADGQEITAIIPFFGDAAFGAAQKSGIIVVFKTNSVYLVDLAAKDRGENAVQRLETRGKGCTAPFSVAVTRGGIMFANDTGLYRLGRDLKVEYVGRKYERKFKQTVNKNLLDLATGHHDTEANAYKLSYPLVGDTQNSSVAVYNHTREYEGLGDGSWTTYDNHPVTGWANLSADSYFSATTGRVFIIRKLGEASDYRDDDQAIVMEILSRALDMGESGRRKVFGKIITHYRSASRSTGTALQASLDLKTVFQDTDTFTITSDVAETGTGDLGTQKILTIASVIDEKVGIYIQVKYTNSTIDEVVEIAGIDFRVAVKTDDGILEARNTSSS